MSWIARVGLALARPRTALAIAGDRRHAGRSGSDLLLALVLLVIATQLRTLVGAVWLGAAVDLGLGVRGLVQVLQGTLTLDLGLLVVAAAAIFFAGGPRRELGRAFDLACVAGMPVVAVQLVAQVIVRAGELDVPPAAQYVLSAAAMLWMFSVAALAIVEMRAATSGAAPASIVVGRRAGLAFVLIAAAGVVVEAAWLARHVDLVRPMTPGRPAPTLALPAIGAHGALGAPVRLADLHGKRVIVDFWATWCGPCLQSLPHLDALARAHPDVAVIAVNLDDAAEARAIFDDHHYAMTLVADDGATSQRYGVGAIPHTVVIDREGVVRHVARGTGIDLERELAGLNRGTEEPGTGN